MLWSHGAAAAEPMGPNNRSPRSATQGDHRNEEPQLESGPHSLPLQTSPGSSRETQQSQKQISLKINLQIQFYKRFISGRTPDTVPEEH